MHLKLQNGVREEGFKFKRSPNCFGVYSPILINGVTFTILSQTERKWPFCFLKKLSNLAKSKSYNWNADMCSIESEGTKHVIVTKYPKTKSFYFIDGLNFYPQFCSIRRYYVLSMNINNGILFHILTNRVLSFQWAIKLTSEKYTN